MLASILAACSINACKRDQVEVSGGAAVDTIAEAPRNILVFPDALRVQDESLNRFVDKAMTECASGDYERFRLLFSAKHDPLPRDEFELGWQAVRQIEIRAVKQIVLAGDNTAEAAGGGSSATSRGSATNFQLAEQQPGKPVARAEGDAEKTSRQGPDAGRLAYAVLAHVSLDPAHPVGHREPHREVVLMIIRERNEWRLAQPPKALRSWIRKQAAPTTAADGSATSKSPAPGGPG